MNSATSTDNNRTDPNMMESAHSSRDARGGLQPWQFFALAALGCVAAMAVLTRGQGATPVILLTLLIATAALVGLAVVRTLGPLVSSDVDRTVMIGQRTRAALEREKLLALRSIKELEFDRAMGKLSDADFQDMLGRLRSRAARLIRQLDAGAGYKEQIERDLVKRLGESATPPSRAVCRACGVKNDSDASFCKACGVAL